MRNRSHPGPRLLVCPVRKPSHPATRLSQGSEVSFPNLPSLPGPLLRLQLALSDATADVGLISDALRSDIGLASRFLRTANQDLGGCAGEFPRFEDLVVHLGLDGIRHLAAQTETLTRHPAGLAALQTCERSWKRARLTALAAEYMAASTGAVDSDKAYLAGLFHHLGYCLRSLNRAEHDDKPVDPHELGYSLACAWDFPPVILDSMRGHRYGAPPSNIQVLREIVKTAAEWVLDVELQGIADSEWSRSLQKTDMSAKGVFKN
jgi:HD-like signal output (HDOD) protein